MVRKTIDDLKKEGRVGIIEFSFVALRDTSISLMLLIMSKLIVLETRCSYWKHTQEYCCISPDFRETVEGEVPPHYQIKVTNTNTEGEEDISKYKIEFEEVKGGI